MGSIRLASADPADKPIIDARYFTDAEGYDLAQLIRGVKEVRKLGNGMLERLGGREVWPGPECTSDAAIEDYVRRCVGTMYHPTGTCKMGRDDDPLAVVDARLRVRGCKRLRVADASVMPEIIGANTNATCVAIGEKCAQMVVEDAADEDSQ